MDSVDVSLLCKVIDTSALPFIGFPVVLVSKTQVDHLKLKSITKGKQTIRIQLKFRYVFFLGAPDMINIPRTPNVKGFFSFSVSPTR